MVIVETEQPAGTGVSRADRTRAARISAEADAELAQASGRRTDRRDANRGLFFAKLQNEGGIDPQGYRTGRRRK